MSDGIDNQNGIQRRKPNTLVRWVVAPLGPDLPVVAHYQCVHEGVIVGGDARIHDDPERSANEQSGYTEFSLLVGK